MNIAIIGGGLTGLSAAHELLKQGHQVTVFEKGSTLGGLAGGFTKPHWKWSLEYYYHHFFTNDSALITLAKELGLEKDMLILQPVTATLTDTPNASAPAIYQLDSPISLLQFPLLSPLDKLRTALLIGFCKLNPFWQPLEKMTAQNFFRTIGGNAAWVKLWYPLMQGKFGDYAPHIAASWLWARFHKRTTHLGYFRGGFNTFVLTLVKAIEKRGGIIYKNTAVQSMKQDVRNTKYEVRITQKNSSYIIRHTSYFDKVLITTPSSIAKTLLMNIQPFDFMRGKLATYNKQLSSIPHLWAQTLIVETTKPILEKTYWLNINDRSFPFLAVVAHTNMVDKKHYGNHHITYIGNYLPEGHPYIKMSKKQLLNIFIPYLKRINPSFVFDLRSDTYDLFTAPNAQPVHTLNYSKIAPTVETPIPGVYLANLDSIYPWDRGTNYAVELGKRAAKILAANR